LLVVFFVILLIFKMIVYFFNKIYHLNSVKKNSGQIILKYPCPRNTT
jgi:hypothetical protein